MSKKKTMYIELPICDTETQSERMLLEEMAPIDLLRAGLPQTFNLFKKKKKSNMHSKTRHACI